MRAAATNGYSSNSAPTKNGALAFEWTPTWNDANGVATLLREAVRVERENKPGSSYLLEFADLARDIVIEHAPAVEIRRISGSFESYTSGDVETGPRIIVNRKEWGGQRYWIHGPEVSEIAVTIPEGVPRDSRHVRRCLRLGYLEREDRATHGESRRREAPRILIS